MRTYTPAQQARTNQRNRARMMRWRSMDILALHALKDRLQSRGITVPAIMWERIAVESSKLRDPRYRAKVLAGRSLDGRPLPRAANAKTYSTKAKVTA